MAVKFSITVPYGEWDGLQYQLKKTERELAEVRARYAVRDDLVSKLRVLIGEKDEMIEAMRQQVSQRDAEIAELKASLSAEYVTMTLRCTDEDARLQNENAKLLADVARLAGEIIGLNTIGRAQREEIERLTREVKALQAEKIVWEARLADIAQAAEPLHFSVESLSCNACETLRSENQKLMDELAVLKHERDTPVSLSKEQALSRMIRILEQHDSARISARRDIWKAVGAYFGIDQ